MKLAAAVPVRKRWALPGWREAGGMRPLPLTVDRGHLRQLRLARALRSTGSRGHPRAPADSLRAVQSGLRARARERCTAQGPSAE